MSLVRIIKRPFLKLKNTSFMKHTLVSGEAVFIVVKSLYWIARLAIRCGLQCLHLVPVAGGVLHLPGEQSDNVFLILSRSFYSP